MESNQITEKPLLRRIIPPYLGLGASPSSGEYMNAIEGICEKIAVLVELCSRLKAKAHCKFVLAFLLVEGNPS